MIFDAISVFGSRSLVDPPLSPTTQRKWNGRGCQPFQQQQITKKKSKKGKRLKTKKKNDG